MLARRVNDMNECPCALLSSSCACVQFERPIRNSPLLLRVTDHINPLRRIGRAPSRALDEPQAGLGGGGGEDEVELVQPAAIAISSKTNTVFVLDTGAHAHECSAVCSGVAR